MLATSPNAGPCQTDVNEKSIGTHETHELAVMCDTFYPLKLTKFAKKLDDGKYAYSWYENAQGMDVRFTCINAGGSCQREEPKDNPEPIFIISHNVQGAQICRTGLADASTFFGGIP